MIKVYSKPGCVQCEFTKKFLVQHELPFEEKNVMESSEALEEMRTTGFTSLPVVVIDGKEPFFGFRPDILITLVD